MTDVQTPRPQRETAGSDPGGDPRHPAAGWLRWGWRQLTSMRTALILLFLLALGSIPGSVLPQQGTDPRRGAAVLHLAPRPGALAEPPGAVQRVRRALVRGDLPAAVRVAGRLRRAADVQAGGLGPDAAAARAAEPGPAAALRRPTPRPCRPRRRSTGPPRCSAASGSGCAARRGRPGDQSTGTGCRPRRGTCARWATCCSTCPCSACCSRSRPAACSATRPTSCWSRGSTFVNTASALDEFHPGRLVSGSDLPAVLADAEQVHRDLHRPRASRAASRRTSTPTSPTPPRRARRRRPTTSGSTTRCRSTR